MSVKKINESSCSQKYISYNLENLSNKKKNTTTYNTKNSKENIHTGDAIKTQLTYQKNNSKSKINNISLIRGVNLTNFCHSKEKSLSTKKTLLIDILANRKDELKGTNRSIYEYSLKRNYIKKIDEKEKNINTNNINNKTNNISSYLFRNLCYKSPQSTYSVKNTGNLDIQIYKNDLNNKVNSNIKNIKPKNKITTYFSKTKEKCKKFSIDNTTNTIITSTSKNTNDNIEFVDLNFNNKDEKEKRRREEIIRARSRELLKARSKEREENEENNEQKISKQKNEKEHIQILNLFSPKKRLNNYNPIRSTKNINKKRYLFSTQEENSINNICNSDKNINNNFIISFFDKLIEFSNAIEEKTIFVILINNLNKKYILNYEKDLEKLIQAINNDHFIYCYKFFSILITAILFLTLDENLYKYSSIKTHLLMNQYIYSCLCYIDYSTLNSIKIQNFLKNFQNAKKVSIVQCVSSIINLLFNDKIEYTSLNKALKQLILNALNKSISEIIKVINETLLFCYNQKPIKNFNNLSFFKKKITTEENLENGNENLPIPPFIKTKMKKNFCLVLDIDETITHSLKLNFGFYFLMRPGLLDFLNEISNFFEIIIFTCSPKIYADSIIDKIDTKGNLISHRLYKNHVVFENGKSIKNLNLIGRDINKIIFVDNLKCNAKNNPKNLYLIPSWTDDIYDDHLMKLKNKLMIIYNSGKFNDDITKGLVQ